MGYIYMAIRDNSYTRSIVEQNEFYSFTGQIVFERNEIVKKNQNKMSDNFCYVERCSKGCEQGCQFRVPFLETRNPKTHFTILFCAFLNPMEDLDIFFLSV